MSNVFHLFPCALSHGVEAASMIILVLLACKLPQSQSLILRRGLNIGYAGNQKQPDKEKKQRKPPCRKEKTKKKTEETLAIRVHITNLELQLLLLDSCHCF
jgi:hypothetical protein